MRRPAQFVPLSVRFAIGRTGTSILRRFGLEGLAVWACLLAACKRSRTPGQISYVGEAEAWELLGLADHRPSFTLESFLRHTGRLKQTRRTRSGRTSYVILTRYEEWNATQTREGARQRKARSRRRSNRDTNRDSPVTSNEPKRDSRAREREIEIYKNLEPRSGTTAASNNRLDVDGELLLAKLLAWIGDHADNHTTAVLRYNLARAAPEARAELEHLMATARPRQRAQWAVAALKRHRQ